MVTASDICGPVVVDGQLADRCASRGPDEETLTEAIFG